MRHLLLYHLFPVNHWREVTAELFSQLPYQGIIVHVSLPDITEERQAEVATFLRQYPVDKVFYSPNSGKGEYDALRRFVEECAFEGYDTLTYLHSKGVTKPGNPHIQNWRRLMYYFVVQRRDLLEQAFRRGYFCYGINKSYPNQADEGFRGCRFFYEGNFVVINLRKVNLREGVKSSMENSYYGVEGFWGKICPPKKAYTSFNSGVNHYFSSVAQADYTTALRRFRYRLVFYYYRLKARFRRIE